VTSGEWGALSGDLATGTTRGGRAVSVGTPRTPVGATVFRVPVEVLGRAIETGYRSASVDDDTGPRLAAPIGAEDRRYRLSDKADSLLRADQVPAYRDLFRPRAQRDSQQTRIFPAIIDGLPPRTPDQEPTQQIPVIADRVPLSAAEVTQRIPVVRAPVPYQPMAGELPVRRAPARPQAPNLTSLPDLPPVPTLPAMPPLPNPRVAGRPVPGPIARPTPQGRPSLFTPNIPPAIESTGPAEQLMAQLRGLISELEHGDTPEPHDF
jgi:hypothetical protein